MASSGPSPPSAPTEGDRYEVVEQNFSDFNPNLEPHWQTFDLAVDRVAGPGGGGVCRSAGGGVRAGCTRQ